MTTFGKIARTLLNPVTSHTLAGKWQYRYERQKVPATLALFIACPISSQRPTRQDGLRLAAHWRGSHSRYRPAVEMFDRLLVRKLIPTDSRTVSGHGLTEKVQCHEFSETSCHRKRLFFSKASTSFHTIGLSHLNGPTMLHGGVEDVCLRC